MFSITLLSFDGIDAPSPRNPQRNIGTNLILLETSHWATTSSSYRSVFMQIFTVSSERRACFETECIINDPEHTVIMTLQGHPMSLADRTNGRAIATLLCLSSVACLSSSSVTLCIVAKRCVLEQKLLWRAYRKSYMRNRLVPR